MHTKQYKLVSVKAMSIRKLNNTAFSLLEILLASVIFIVSIGGIFVTLSAVRRPVADKESALSAAIFGKQVLESLRSQVNASTYYGNCSAMNANGACVDFSLYLGKHQVPHGTLPLSWPINLEEPNTNMNAITNCDTSVACLVYTVSCADSTADFTSCTTGGSNPDMARRVDLSINWPNAV